MAAIRLLILTGCRKPSSFTVSSPESVTPRAAESNSASSLVKSRRYQCRHTIDRTYLPDRAATTTVELS